MRKSVYTIALLLFCVIIPSTTIVAQDEEVIAFVEAIDEGEIEKVKEYLNGGIDPNLEFHSNTPLMFAIWSGKFEIFKLLVENGALIEKKVEKKDPLINMAASSGNNEICEYLLSKGANIDSKDREGKTPLMNAIYSKHPETVKLLIDSGANVNEQEINGWSALMFATMQGETESVQLLINAGADVNSETNDGETPLQRAEKIHNAKLKDLKETIDILKKAGAE